MPGWKIQDTFEPAYPYGPSERVWDPKITKDGVPVATYDLQGHITPMSYHPEAVQALREFVLDCNDKMAERRNARERESRRYAREQARQASEAAEKALLGVNKQEADDD